MSETQNSTGSVPSSDKIEDTLTRMKVNEENMEQSSPYPDRPGEKDCEFFVRTGQCGYGNSCRYNHPLTHLTQGVFYHRDELPERIGQPDCEYYLKTGACKYGSTCKYHHPKDRNGAKPVLFNVLGYPMRQGEKSCPYYMQTGMCRFGVACKFHHPQPHNGHSTTTYGMSSYAGFPYAGGLPMMSLPPATYGVMPPPYPQAYMPFMFAPPHGWSPYMAGSNPIYNVKARSDSGSERAECRFFMNTGACKYGDDCKYRHPKVRISPSPSRSDSTAENHNSEIEKQDQVISDKSEVQDSLQPSSSELTAISNGNKPGAESHSSEIEKQEDISDKSEVQDSSQLNLCDPTVVSPTAENHSSEIERQEDISDKSEVQGCDSNGKSDAESPSSETKKQEDNPSQQDN